MGGLIYNFDGSNYFISSSSYGMIFIINLDVMEQVGDMRTFDNCNFYNIVKWNEKYLLILDSYFGRIDVMDFDNFKIKSMMAFPEFKSSKYMKKVVHPVYGEALLVIGIDFKINLYVNRSITKLND